MKSPDSLMRVIFMATECTRIELPYRVCLIKAVPSSGFRSAFVSLVPFVATPFP